MMTLTSCLIPLSLSFVARTPQGGKQCGICGQHRGDILRGFGLGLAVLVSNTRWRQSSCQPSSSGSWTCLLSNLLGEQIQGSAPAPRNHTLCVVTWSQEICMLVKV